MNFKEFSKKYKPLIDKEIDQYLSNKKNEIKNANVQYLYCWFKNMLKVENVLDLYQWY